MSEETQKETSRISAEQVADLLTELGEIADRSGLQSLKKEVFEERLPMLTQEQITLVVLGEFNHGKSTIVNALLNEEVLPMGITPTTAVITHLVYGQKRKISVKPVFGEKYEIELSELEDVIRHAEDEKDEPEFVEISHPNAFLNQSLTLVDTPGVNDISRQKVEITYGYVPRADVILYVLDATQVLKKSEVVFIRDRLLTANRDRIIFILGKIDALDEDDAAEVESYARERLEGLIGEVQLFALSGKAALDLQSEGKPAPPEFLKFKDHLSNFLSDQRAYIILDSALGGGARIATMLEQNLAIKKQGYLLEKDELVKRIANVSEKLESSRKLIAENLDLIDEKVSDIAASAKRNLRTFNEAFQSALPMEIEKADAKDVKLYLPSFIQDTFKGFLEKEGENLAGDLEELAEEIIQITNESLRDTVESLRDELGVGKDLDLEVDTIAYDVGVFALGALGVSVYLFANALVGGLLTLAAPVLAFFLKDKVDSQIKDRAREAGVKSIESASQKVEEELLHVIHDYGDRLKTFVETAGDKLYRQIEEVLEQVLEERKDDDDVVALAKEVDERLSEVRSVAHFIAKSRENLISSALS